MRRSRTRRVTGDFGRKKSDEQRAILALRFDPFEKGYLYYLWRWSRGVPVTVEEREARSEKREAYLSIPALRSRRAWRKSIAGRPISPPRPFQPVQRKLLATMPISMVVMTLFIGLPLALSGLAELQTIGGLACAVGGLLAVVFKAQIIFAKFLEKSVPYPAEGVLRVGA
jgi:hypothetical protein